MRDFRLAQLTLGTKLLRREFSKAISTGMARRTSMGDLQGIPGHLPSGSPTKTCPEKEKEKAKKEFRARGHLYASANPLRPTAGPPRDMGESVGLGIRQYLLKTYCGPIGYEIEHVEDSKQREWLYNQIESAGSDAQKLSSAEKIMGLERLISAEEMEVFLGRRFPGEKRFGLEGGESLIAFVSKMIESLSIHGNKKVYIGMAHRGRLNMLVNVLGKPLETIMHEFSGKPFLLEQLNGAANGSEKFLTGDVKYHLGHQTKRQVGDRQVEITLLPNPSHLEAVGPVTMGMARGSREKAIGIVIHGDSAISGQGVVYESMGMNGLDGFSTGGTIHIVSNNQIGFTTDVSAARSTRYCTDIAKTFGTPVLHVNGSDVTAVLRTAKLAVLWRERFGKDIVVDIIGWRKNGHNEFDDPTLTQPTMYSLIRNRPTQSKTYSSALVNEGVIHADSADKMRQSYKHKMKAVEERYNQGLSADKRKTSLSGVSSKETSECTKGGSTNNTEETIHDSAPVHNNGNIIGNSSIDTGITAMQARRLLRALSIPPKDFKLHRLTDRLLTQHAAMATGKLPIDMGAAEALAMGSLLEEGHGVRFTGQDVERGTFGHRHVVISDQKSNAKWMPLHTLAKNTSDLQICNSPLNEYAVLGFEYGFSLKRPDILTMWEAQFGDFVNTAQVVLDQYLVSARQKWGVHSGLVVLLPHGYDGNGPEHSSGRIERFLGQSADPIPKAGTPLSRLPQHGAIQEMANNFFVFMPSTPANYFHMLRRQVLSPRKVPCVAFTSKALLRHPMCKSHLEDLGNEKGLRKIIPDPRLLSTMLTKEKPIHVFCSGQIYYKLEARRKALGLDNVYITRIEQISPFPYEEVASILSSRPSETAVTWAQEEPINCGPWPFVSERLGHIVGDSGNSKPVRIAARERTSSVATGISEIHKMEEAKVLEDALMPAKRKVLRCLTS